MFTKSARFYDAIYAWKDYEAEVAKLRAIVDDRLPVARSLLDVACGTGKHLELLREHFEVEGVDLDPNLLSIARERLPGVALHEGDMTSFDLGRELDVVTCLFSSIAYARTEDGLRAAASSLARHARHGGLVIVEPWFGPDEWELGRVHSVFVDEPELKVARINTSERDGDLSVVEFHYLVGTAGSVEHFTERHEVGLFTHDKYMAAFERAGLEVTHDPEGLMGRGLYVGVRA